MKLQRQLSKKRGDKIYHKYVLVVPEDKVKEAGLSEGDELEVNAKKGELSLRKV